MRLLTRLALNTLSLLVVAYLVPGFSFSGLWAAVVTAIVIGVVNTFIKPVLQIIALPISIITFGITAFLINVLLLLLVSRIVPGFEIENFITATLASIALSLVSWFLQKISS